MKRAKMRQYVVVSAPRFSPSEKRLQSTLYLSKLILACYSIGIIARTDFVTTESEEFWADVKKKRAVWAPPVSEQSVVPAKVLAARRSRSTRSVGSG